MKVLKITTWYPNPFLPLSGSFVRDQAIALRDEKIDVSVLFVDMGVHHFSKKITHYSNKSTFEIEDGIPTFRYQGLFLPKRTKYVFDKWVQYFDVLYQDYFSKYGMPDILHAHNYQAGYAAFFLSKKYNLPYIITEHSSIFLQEKLSSSQIDIAKIAFKDAAKIIAVSEGLKKALQNYTDQPITTIPNLIDTSFFQINPQKNTDEKFRLIAVGDLVKIKCFDILVQAIANLDLKKKEKIHLQIIGEGSERKVLEALIKKHQLTNQVFLLGEKKREEVAHLLNQSDAFVLPSSFETFGIVLIEAIASGLPVIATMCVGPEEIVHQKNGILIPINDVNALKNAIEKMQLTHHNYDSLAMRKEIINKYDNTTIANQLKKIYETFLP